MHQTGVRFDVLANFGYMLFSVKGIGQKLLGEGKSSDICPHEKLKRIHLPKTLVKKIVTLPSSDSGDDNVGPYWLSSNCAASLNDHVSEDDME